MSSVLALVPGLVDFYDKMRISHIQRGTVCNKQNLKDIFMSGLALKVTKTPF
jgi:hypothetical protein